MVVGASTDMPSLIKAHAGLPEHVLASVLGSGLPIEPRWIYADPFHTLVAPGLDAGRPGATAREIHTGEAVVLADLATQKRERIPPAAEAAEWGRFLHPGLALPDARIGLPGLNGEILEGTHLHDGWKSTPAPVYVKYLGYPAGECVYPDCVLTLHPGRSTSSTKTVICSSSKRA